jgi:hypothetical protein
MFDGRLHLCVCVSDLVRRWITTQHNTTQHNTTGYIHWRKKTFHRCSNLQPYWFVIKPGLYKIIDGRFHVSTEHFHRSYRDSIWDTVTQLFLIVPSVTGATNLWQLLDSEGAAHCISGLQDAGPNCLYSIVTGSIIWVPIFRILSRTTLWLKIIVSGSYTFEYRAYVR